MTTGGRIHPETLHNFRRLPFIILINQTSAPVCRFRSIGSIHVPDAV